MNNNLTGGMKELQRAFVLGVCAVWCGAAQRLDHTSR